MKKTVLFSILAVICLSFYGCKEKNDPTPTTKTYQWQTFDEPCLLWGSDMGTVKNWMTENGFKYKNSEYAGGEIEYAYYYSRHKEEKTMLVFYIDSYPTYYHTAYIYINIDALEDGEMSGFLCERYNLVDDGTYSHFRTKDNKTDIYLSADTIDDVSYFIIQYIKAE